MTYVSSIKVSVLVVKKGAQRNRIIANQNLTNLISMGSRTGVRHLTNLMKRDSSARRNCFMRQRYIFSLYVVLKNECFSEKQRNFSAFSRKTGAVLPLLLNFYSHFSRIIPKKSPFPKKRLFLFIGLCARFFIRKALFRRLHPASRRRSSVFVYVMLREPTGLNARRPRKSNLQGRR